MTTFLVLTLFILINWTTIPHQNRPHLLICWQMHYIQLKKWQFLPFHPWWSQLNLKVLCVILLNQLQWCLPHSILQSRDACLGHIGQLQELQTYHWQLCPIWHCVTQKLNTLSAVKRSNSLSNSPLFCVPKKQG